MGEENDDVRDSLRQAIADGDLDRIRNMPISTVREYVMLDAAELGRKEAIEWALGNDVAWDARVTSVAYEHYNVDLCKWAADNGCPWDEELLRHASKRGDLEMIQWAVGQGCPWHEDVTYNAAERNDREMLRWVLRNGCPWHECVTVAAAESGSIEMIKYVMRKGCEYDMMALVEASRCGHKDIVEWILELGDRCNRRRFGDAAAGMQPVTWNSQAILSAMSRRHTEIVELFIARGLYTPPSP